MWSNRDIRQMLAVLGWAILGIPIGLLALLLGGVWAIDSFASIHAVSTKDAPGFSEKGFARIQIGMTAAEVEKSLGRPLKVSHNRRQQVDEWHYTERKGFFIPFAGSWDVRAVVLSNNLVTTIIRESRENI